MSPGDPAGAEHALRTRREANQSRRGIFVVDGSVATRWVRHWA